MKYVTFFQDFFDDFGDSFLLIFLAQSFLGRLIFPAEMSGNSMSPTLESGQLLWIVKPYLSIQRGELVYYKLSEEDCVTRTGCEYVKRVIALPGDTVTLKGGRVFVNDEQLEEPYVNPSGVSREGEFLPSNQSIRLLENEYFIMGDNREFSYDSRSHGPITKDLILGKPL